MNDELAGTNIEIAYHPEEEWIKKKEVFRIQGDYDLVGLSSDKTRTTLLTAMGKPVSIKKLEEELDELGINILAVDYHSYKKRKFYHFRGSIDSNTKHF